MKNNKKKSSKRKPGGGRKALYTEPMVKLNVWIPEYLAQHIQAVIEKEQLKGRGAKSDAVRIIFDRDMEKKA